ncbi:MAG: glycerol dehydratase reactivase beta/small subunit family protein [Methylocystaceae bacterium]
MLTDKMQERPRVIICTTSSDYCEDRIRELQAGLEEEGVPHAVLRGNDGDVSNLAWQGANASQLGVGLGVSPYGLCIHYHKLPESEPLFTTDDAGDEETWRRFGSNAARLVKGLPFKTEITSELMPDEDLVTLYSTVREIIIMVLQEISQVNGR